MASNIQKNILLKLAMAGLDVIHRQTESFEEFLHHPERRQLSVLKRQLIRTYHEEIDYLKTLLEIKQILRQVSESA